MHTARLVNATPDAEKALVYMARVSNPANQSNDETAPNLIRYLIKHKHWSPFQMADMTVEIETTRAISAQILRHSSFDFQEFSQRYADVSTLPPIDPPMLRRQDLKNRQASHDDLADDLKQRLNNRIAEHYAQSLDLYRYMLDMGVAKECAREVLPLGTCTRMYMHGNLRNWIFYLQVRCSIETQLEHRMVANSIKEIFVQQFPILSEAVFGES